MSETEFEYGQIDLDRPSFRLIRLLGRSHTEIDCELFDAYLDQVEYGSVPYEALSYTWGGMKKPAKIRINGMNMGVTENLFMALHYLRPEDNYRILWIDAICINQGHQKERGQQVQQMGDIYKKAERVIVWLGTGTKDSDFIMDFLKTLPLNTAAHPECAVVPRKLKARYCEAFETLLRRPWFRRVWILQEVANARRAVIVCGWKCVSTRIFTAAPFLLEMEPDFRSKAVLDVMPGRLRERSWYLQQPTLRTLLQKFHESEASDKRDMTYALLGMSSSVCERNNLRADYRKDLQKLIQDATSILLFPECPGTSSFCYIDWSWSEFVKNLKTLSSAAFSCARERTQVAELERFLDRDDIDVNWKDEVQRTPLARASECGNCVMVKLLVAREDTEMNSKDTYGQTPLWIAAERGHEDVVRALFERDIVEVNLNDNLGKTPLWIAAERGHEGVLRALIERGDIEINSEDKDEKMPLWVAAERGHEGIVRILLKCDGVEVNLKDNGGRTLLWTAAERGHEGVVRVLLEIDGIKASSKDNLRMTPLWIAAERGHTRVVRALVESDSIEVNLKDKGERTLLWTAAERGHEGVVRVLLEINGIEVNSKDEFGRTPLWTAAYMGRESIVRVLLRSDCIQVNLKDNRGRTPLWIAAYSGNERVVRALVESDNIEVNVKDSFGRTPLWTAAERGYEGVVRVLLAIDSIEVNSKDNLGMTPLWIAAERGHKRVVGALAESDNIELISKNKDGKTPLSMAAEWIHKG
jgi:ankyrin repeat protein